MNIHVEKTQKNKSQSVTNEHPEKRVTDKSTFQLMDNRPVALALRRQQKLVKNSPRAEKTAQLQSMEDKPLAQQQFIQIVESSTNDPIQRKWLDSGEPDLEWDVPVDGVTWYYNQVNKLMYFLILDKSKAHFLPYAGKANAKPREEWVKLYGSDPLSNEDATVITSGYETDSEDEVDEIAGIELHKKDHQAEFDGYQPRKKKLYEDKNAQVRLPPENVYCKTHKKKYGEHSDDEVQQDLAQILESWVKKNIRKKVEKIVKALGAVDENTRHEMGDGHSVALGHRDPADQTQQETVQINPMSLQEVNRIKFRLNNSDVVFRRLVLAEISKLDNSYPTIRFTVKFGAPMQCHCFACVNTGLKK